MRTYRDSEESSTEVPEISVGSTPENSDRRMLLKKLAIGTVAVAGCSVLPDKWTSPIVEFGALPAHAVTSGTPEAVTKAAPAPAPPPPETKASGTEDGIYWGRHNGDRPTWYFSKPMRDYPQQFTVVIDGCATVQVTSNNGTRFVRPGVIVKQSDVSGRGMAVIGSPSCGSRTCHIVF